MQLLHCAPGQAEKEQAGGWDAVRIPGGERREQLDVLAGDSGALAIGCSALGRARRSRSERGEKSARARFRATGGDPGGNGVLGPLSSTPELAVGLRCTYRLQLLPHLDFEEARTLVPYLEELGVSHLYLSPSLQARVGSSHGYDVVDPTRISDHLGGEERFRALCKAGLDVILDVVPNYMAASEDENPFWREELTRAKFFDVEWRSGGVRRFFDIGDLAGVRVEDAEVFEVTHAKLVELVREGLVNGVRIDHPDGLANPARYLERLQHAGIDRIWVEKILADGEQLRDWPVEGATGYSFANDVTRLFLDAEAEEPLTSFYGELTGEHRLFGDVAFEAKLEQTSSTFTQEVGWLRDRLADVDNAFDLQAALASFDIYRTYVDPDNSTVDGLDRQAVANAGLPPRLADILLLEERGYDTFVTRFQQTLPAVTAKGVEDTAFYRYNRLLCLNEVGGDPGLFSLPIEEFHARNLERVRRFPHGLLTTQTHDTKRSGDARSRLAALTWCAGEWEQHVREWRRLNKPLRAGSAPDPNEEYLIYQTLVAVWPIEPDRMTGFLQKALREGKTHSSWTEPDERWEEAVKAFARGLYENTAFLDSFEPFVERVARDGRRIGLGQTLLKLTCPGVPDIYQGDELWSSRSSTPTTGVPSTGNCGKSCSPS